MVEAAGGDSTAATLHMIDGGGHTRFGHGMGDITSCEEGETVVRVGHKT